jgi:hypothetical protein
MKSILRLGNTRNVYTGLNKTAPVAGNITCRLVCAILTTYRNWAAMSQQTLLENVSKCSLSFIRSTLTFRAIVLCTLCAFGAHLHSGPLSCARYVHLEHTYIQAHCPVHVMCIRSTLTFRAVVLCTLCAFRANLHSGPLSCAHCVHSEHTFRATVLCTLCAFGAHLHSGPLSCARYVHSEHT